MTFEWLKELLEGSGGWLLGFFSGSRNGNLRKLDPISLKYEIKLKNSIKFVIFITVGPPTSPEAFRGRNPSRRGYGAQ
jgi:hypothetical protein